MKNKIYKLSEAQKQKLLNKNLARQKPDFLPPEFWDAEQGTVMLEKLINELAKAQKLSKAQETPETAAVPEQQTEQQEAINPQQSNLTELAEKVDSNLVNDSASGGDILAKEILADQALNQNTAENTQAIEATENTPIAEATDQEVDDFDIDIKSSWLKNNKDINLQLIKAGLNKDQTQLVYDIAADAFEKIAETIAKDHSTMQDQQKLEKEFGGQESWERLRERLQEWASKNLSPDMLDAMGSSYDGVKALLSMMEGNESNPLNTKNLTKTKSSELERLRSLMRDKRYWKQKDPAFRAKVREGFERIFS